MAQKHTSHAGTCRHKKLNTAAAGAGIVSSEKLFFHGDPRGTGKNVLTWVLRHLLLFKYSDCKKNNYFGIGLSSADLGFG